MKLQDWITETKAICERDKQRSRVKITNFLGQEVEFEPGSHPYVETYYKALPLALQVIEKLSEALKYYSGQTLGPYVNPKMGGYMSIENDAGIKAKEALTEVEALLAKNQEEK